MPASDAAKDVTIDQLINRVMKKHNDEQWMQSAGIYEKLHHNLLDEDG